MTNFWGYSKNVWLKSWLINETLPNEHYFRIEILHVIFITRRPPTMLHLVILCKLLLNPIKFRRKMPPVCCNCKCKLFICSFLFTLIKYASPYIHLSIIHHDSCMQPVLLIYQCERQDLSWLQPSVAVRYTECYYL